MNHLRIAAIVCTLFVIGACKKGLPPQPKFLVVNKTTVTLPGTADSHDTIFIGSDDDWVAAVETGVDWITVSPSSGTGNGMILIKSASDNTGNTRRTAVVELKAVNSTAGGIVTVVQLQLNETVLNKVFGGEGYDTFNDITATPDGGYIAVGVSSSLQGDGTGSKGGQDMWAVKFTADGEKVWHKKFGGTLDDAANSIIRTPANNYIILGSTLSNDGDVTDYKGNGDAWLIEIDGDGNLLWQKTLGGSGEEKLYNLKPSGDGSYLMAGWTLSNDGDVSDNAGDKDAWIVSVDEEGNIAWNETYGGTEEDLAYDATPVSDGGYIFCGRLKSMDGDGSGRTSETYAAWIVKLNPEHAIGGKIYLGETEFDFGAVALEASNGDYVIAGETNTPSAFDNFHANRDVFICRLDATGNIKWRKAFGGSMRDEPGDLIETDDGDFVLGGLSTSSDGDLTRNGGGEDGWLLRVEGDGDVVNSLSIGGPVNDNIKKIKHLNINNFAFIGLSGSYEDGYPALPEIMHGWFQVVNLP